MIQQKAGGNDLKLNGPEFYLAAAAAAAAADADADDDS
jgi:hypothetical protein